MIRLGNRLRALEQRAARLSTLFALVLLLGICFLSFHPEGLLAIARRMAFSSSWPYSLPLRMLWVLLLLSLAISLAALFRTIAAKTLNKLNLDDSAADGLTALVAMGLVIFGAVFTGQPNRPWAASVAQPFGTTVILVRAILVYHSSKSPDISTYR